MQRLTPEKIEKEFVQVAIDLKDVIVLDGVDQLPGNRFRIRSHDLYGPLPAIEIEDDRDRLKVVDDIHREAAKLSAIHGLRKELVEMFEDARFLEPTLMNQTAVVGISYGNGKYTTMAEGTSFLDAYHKLREKVIDEILPTERILYSAGNCWRTTLGPPIMRDDVVTIKCLSMRSAR